MATANTALTMEELLKIIFVHLRGRSEMRRRQDGLAHSLSKFVERVLAVEATSVNRIICWMIVDKLHLLD